MNMESSLSNKVPMFFACEDSKMVELPIGILLVVRQLLSCSNNDDLSLSR